MNFQEFKTLYQFQEVKEYPNTISRYPKVTVCVQTYNHELFISKCLESILEQETDFSFEILISEDDSSDKTREICIAFADKYPNKIKLFLHDRKNNIQFEGEPTGNFPTIYNLFSAKGKYIAICEGDDFWGDPLKLQKQFDFMEAKPSYSICYHDFKIVNKGGEIIKSDKAFSFKKDLEARELMHPVFHPATLTIFFRNKLKELPEEIMKVITIDAFIYILLGHFGRGKFLNSIEPAFYRIHANGIWSARKLDKKLLAKIETYKAISRFYLKKGKTESSLLFLKKIIKLKLYLIYLSFKWN